MSPNRESHPTESQTSPVTGEFSDFAQLVVRWQRVSGRHDLPWQGTGNPYHVWLSEIMLQQTQVKAVIPYYQRFLSRFPDVFALAAADETTLMGLWAGLGYYARARNLLACARLVVEQHGGIFPDSVEALSALPGIGRSTAGAVLSLSGRGVAPILDGNVRRVFARCFGVAGYTGLPKVQAQLWALADAHVPGADDVMAYNQGLMDLGATLCTRSKPRCGDCPVQRGCIAHRDGLTAVLPTPKPPAVRRTEHHLVTIDVVNRSLRVQVRPERGIWAGLWMAPMQRLDAAPLDAAPAVVHELTHRRYCLYAQCAPSGPNVAALMPTERWLPLPLADDAPVPAALHRLLAVLGLNDQPV